MLKSTQERKKVADCTASLETAMTSRSPQQGPMGRQCGTPADMNNYGACFQNTENMCLVPMPSGRHLMRIPGVVATWGCHKYFATVLLSKKMATAAAFRQPSSMEAVGTLLPAVEGSLPLPPLMGNSTASNQAT